MNFFQVWVLSLLLKPSKKEIKEAIKEAAMEADTEPEKQKRKLSISFEIIDQLGWGRWFFPAFSLAMAIAAGLFIAGRIFFASFVTVIIIITMQLLGIIDTKEKIEQE